MIKNITVEEALGIGSAVIVDVRSEEEYGDTTIPGAINVPLLNNEERARVGTVYKQVSPVDARKLGMELIAPKLVELVNTIEAKAAPGKKVILFCWRGGLRSQFVSYVLDLMGFDVYRINGGYKAYRRYVNAYLNESVLQHRAVVTHGLTGVGKTLVLRELLKMGMPVLDLEGLAVHRGSVYGKIGLPPSPGQKQFEALLFEELRRAEEKGVFLVECESRRLGRLLVPIPLMNAMKNGYRILLYTSLEVRIRRSIEEYTAGARDKDVVPQLLEATSALVRYLGNKKVEEINSYITQGQIDKAVELLLVEYYDPLYKYPDRPAPEYHISVDTTDIKSAADQIYKFVSALNEYNVPVSGGVPIGNWEGSKGSKGIKGDVPGNC
ncbi:MAG: tRNA 2-selenouridine synthase [Peptococcaceae bacterium BICA1-7]|nr:MAG: tRNA 2-selenouridine synthase [Peptococcaceae bacterium BICA1-7]HBV97323.1 tRNA 2-selenouridine(34) synthase MnmH [Desulfotomaculum sp.]